MKTRIFFCIFMLLALSCVGQKDDSGQEQPQVPENGPNLPGAEGRNYWQRSLVLDFTGTWCVNCPRMETAIHEARSARPGRIIPVSVHCLPVDKMALLPLSQELASRFGVSAYPSVIIDLDSSSLLSVSSSDLILAQCDRLLSLRPESTGIRLATKPDGNRARVEVESHAVQDGSYRLHLLLLEDGIVAPQTGGSSEHVHNNVLRAWHDSDVYADVKKGVTLNWEVTVEADATASLIAVAAVSKDGLLLNACSCQLGDSVPYQYEED